MIVDFEQRCICGHVLSQHNGYPFAATCMLCPCLCFAQTFLRQTEPTFATAVFWAYWRIFLHKLEALPRRPRARIVRDPKLWDGGNGQAAPAFQEFVRNTDRLIARLGSRKPSAS